MALDQVGVIDSGFSLDYAALHNRLNNHTAFRACSNESHW
jgi:hypothetical protein